MPAVNTFAMYASLSILINFLLQITAFVALLSLDSRRAEVNSTNIIKIYKNLYQKIFIKNFAVLCEGNLTLRDFNSRCTNIS